MHTDIICGLDIGSSSIKVLIGEDSEKILGFSDSTTKGFTKGVVSNLNLLSDVIEDAVSKAESSAHCRVRKVITNISGVHIRTFKSRGSIHISDRPSEITKEHLSRCIESAKLIAMSLDRDIIHLVPERFYIDDKIEISEPIGLFGSKLDVDLNIITSLVSVLQNITKAINLAGYEVEEMVISGMGTSMAIFDRNELEEGALIIDAGKDIIEVCIFIDGKLKDCFYFPFGGDDLSKVLQEELKMMFGDAEELRLGGSIFSKDDSNINVSNLLLQKVEDIIKDIHKKIEPFLKDRKSLPRAAVTGGLSRMDGFIEVIERVFNMPVELARLIKTNGFYDTNFACSLGLMRYGAMKRAERSTRYILNSSTLLGRLVSKVRDIASDYF